MTKLAWDQVGQRRYETGVDHGVLYRADGTGAFNLAYPWNGLTTITESPSGAESNKQYADNIEYLNLLSAEQFGATLEAFTYPDEFEECDGTAVVNGVMIGQQGRKSFGLSYRSKVGNDQDDDLGYKIHIVYGCKAAPSEKARTTVNDSPEAMGLSWEISTTPVQVTGTNPDTGKEFKPTSHLVIDSTQHTTAAMQALEDILYGTAGADGRLPSPNEVISLFAGAIVEVTTVDPTYNASTDIVTIPAVTGVQYLVDGVEVPSGPFGPITGDVVVTAVPEAGYSFTATSDNDWTIRFA